MKSRDLMMFMLIAIVIPSAVCAMGREYDQRRYPTSMWGGAALANPHYNRQNRQFLPKTEQMYRQEMDCRVEQLQATCSSCSGHIDPQEYRQMQAYLANLEASHAAMYVTQSDLAQVNYFTPPTKLVPLREKSHLSAFRPSPLHMGKLPIAERRFAADNTEPDLDLATLEIAERNPAEAMENSRKVTERKAAEAHAADQEETEHSIFADITNAPTVDGTSTDYKELHSWR